MDIAQLHQIFLDSTGVTTDTRSIGKGSIFFALKGERFNGNEFASKAIEQGASYAVVAEPQDSTDKCFIQVDDVLGTLQALASYHRTHLNVPIIGITGSNGKTTTKELMRDVLAKKYNVLATKGNLNNHIGVPLTLLQLTEAHELAIIEMGANHLGEIELLSAISNPNYGLITNIGQAHIGEFGGQENIISAKTELYKHLQKTEGICFVNGASTLLLEKSSELQQVIYGDNPASTAQCSFTSSDPFLSFHWASQEIETQLIGDYNLINMSAAIAVGLHFKVPEEQISAALRDYSPDNNRSQLIRKGDSAIIMDAYNANPDSVSAALKNLAGIDHPMKLAIIGDMLELGPESERAHKKIVALAKSLSIRCLFVGAEFQKYAQNSDEVYIDTAKAAPVIAKMELAGYLILIKGSRGIKLEVLLDLF